MRREENRWFEEEVNRGKKEYDDMIAQMAASKTKLEKLVKDSETLTDKREISFNKRDQKVEQQ